jgi:hypothetical protein
MGFLNIVELRMAIRILSLWRVQIVTCSRRWAPLGLFGFAQEQEIDVYKHLHVCSPERCTGA